LCPAGEQVISSATKKRALKNLRIRSQEISLPRLKRDRLTDILETESAGIMNLQMMPLLYEDFDSEASNCLDTFLDYASRGSIIAYDNFRAIGSREEEIINETNLFLLKSEEEEKFYLERHLFNLSLDDLAKRGRGFPTIYVNDFPCDGREILRFYTEKNVGLKQDPMLLKMENGLLTDFADRIRDWMAGGNIVAFLCGEEETQRIIHILEGYSLNPEISPSTLITELEEFGDGGRLILKTGKITEGFSYPSLRLVVVSEEEVFGKKKKRRKKARSREGYFLKSFGELKKGDYVVHVDHGIGIYRELKRLSVGGVETDFILIDYSDEDKLYIPVDRLDQIQRYIGAEGYMPTVDKLGGTSWDSVKKKVKQSVRKIAEELVSIYAAREVMEGHRFASSDRYYEEFASLFEFEETPDQAAAIEDVINDLSESKPMDRLICGDAGFGKTEVALRASFLVVMDGKQVAFLVPTTILAEQHYQTFVKRFEKYPVRVEVLNRFKTKAQQKKIVEDIKEGLVDIVIGTHRILQKDIGFKDLGLVVIDEEQRFGVSHKEKLKKLRTLVDVLTLTATPIPRTLQLSLVGIRDLSVIETPPQDRQSVTIRVAEFDEGIIKDAIKNEIGRKGQVFFVHDRVRSIYSMARFIKELLPEAKIAVAHGQMKAKELEDVMVKFIHKESNVLICTTIISAGLDIPSANTIIINRAERLGLSLLYQLRGRVGRSNEEAYSYLMIPRGMVLTKDARKRIRVAQEFTDAGSGFKVATHDLEIRGGGSLLGVSQSGHVSAVGYELYTQLMERAIRELRGETGLSDEISPEIHLGIPAFIPDDFIVDTQTRLFTYKKISAATDEQVMSSLREELIDCYGFIPPQVNNLMDIIRIRSNLKGIMGKKMTYDGRHMTVSFHKKSPIDPSKIIQLSRKKFKGLTFTPDYHLSVPASELKGMEAIEKARALLAELTN
ncbi:MAG: transcription-repair coupling factor, partial [Deltaproteobacteria bacterium]|nr:transcription-repair coupling factor [Deltaproteobacteria bacterium]